MKELTLTSHSIASENAEDIVSAIKRPVTNRSSKLTNWAKENWIFLLILVFGIAIRLFYFNLTKTQPVWWDESDYLAFAKNLAGLGGDWIVTAQHNSIFPFILAILFKVGLSEAMTKFLVIIIPSILLIPLTYYTVILIYKDKNIALISTFLMAVFWQILFNSMRFHLAAPGLLAGLLAIYIFFKGYERKEKIFSIINPKWAIPLAVIFIIFTYAIRRGYFLFGLFFLLFMLLTRPFHQLIKDKYNWIALGIVAVILLIVEKFIFVSELGAVASTYVFFENKINLLPFDVFKSYFSGSTVIQSILFYLFWIGVIIMILSVIMYLGHIKKSRNQRVLGDLYVLISIFTTLSYFIFFLRAQDSFGDPRWYLPLALASFMAIGRGTVFIADKIKKYNKQISVIIIVVLIGIGGYYQYQQADGIIRNRLTSYSGIQEASLYIKDLTSKEDVIISQSSPQTIYYSERIVERPSQISEWETNDVPLERFIEKLHERPDAKYLFVSFSEPNHPEWMKRIESSGGRITAWEIPFMDTRIDFITGQQNVVETKTYGNITFKLDSLKGDIFIYEIQR